jgi:hypothetical protein
VLERLTNESHALERPLTVSVLKANPRARAFYERAGFSVVSSTESHDQMTWTGARAS